MVNLGMRCPILMLFQNFKFRKSYFLKHVNFKVIKWMYKCLISLNLAILTKVIF